jgi:hypothetical protein
MATVTVKADIVDTDDSYLDNMREGSLMKPRDELKVPASHVRNLLVEILIAYRKIQA